MQTGSVWRVQKNMKYVSWMIASFFMYLQFIIQTSSSLFQNAWAHDFGLTPLSVGLLSASFFYTYLFFQIPIGVIYDRFSEKKVLALASAGLACGCVLFAKTTNFHLAIFARMLMGACAAFGFIGMLKVTVNNFPGKQFALMMGLGECVASLVTMLGVMILSWAISYLTWQQLMLCLALCIFTITILVILFVQSKSQPIKSPFNVATLVRNVVRAATNRTVLLIGIYGFFMASVVNSFTSLWGVAFLTDAYPISSTLAANVMSTVFLGLAVGCPINGYISKRYGHEREAMMICSLICACLMAAIIFVKVSVPMLYVMFFVVGLMCSVYVQCFTVVGQSVSVEIQATSMAVTNMLVMSSAPLLQIFIGGILDAHSFGYAVSAHQNYQFALSVLPIGMLIGFVLCFLIKIPEIDLHAHHGEMIADEGIN